MMFYLKSLPNLSSLTASLLDSQNDDFAYVYRIIFDLKPLRYLKLDASTYQRLNLDLPIAVHGQFSSLEYLVIFHPIFLDELAHLLSYASQLSHFSCSNLIESHYDMKFKESIKSKNLEHLTIITHSLIFDRFQEFFTKLFLELTVLIMTINDTVNSYLNDSRWEYLITKHMPDLKKFVFRYNSVVNEGFQIRSYHEFINGSFEFLFPLLKEGLCAELISLEKRVDVRPFVRSFCLQILSIDGRW
ncbi:unnamed protein product [Adineta ricciae]|uniref:Uncharacterized protein n=1 Tax=Adineta ricciae TaxID=249248 RepID=A0A814ECS5_ADIRI|nr:unnamed protein product [Adineta ricciae]CAF0967081.1 unnamed protein product [Adineta ricciae]